MNTLALGDVVLTDKNTYERVYRFGHADANLLADYVQLRTASTTLEMSRDHMVFAKEGRAIPASNVKVGDALVLSSGEVGTVHTIKTITRRGAFAPFTPSGTIVVNGVKASSFVAFQVTATLNVGGLSTGLTYQWIGHMIEFPHRMWCMYVSDCLDEHYLNGISSWVALPHNLTLWFVGKDHQVMQGILFIPILMMLGCSWQWPRLCYCSL